MKSHILSLAACLALMLMVPAVAESSPLRSGAQARVLSGDVPDGVELTASRKYKRLKPGCRAAFCRPGYNYGDYKKWKRKRDFGRAVVGGIIIGAVIVTAAHAAPRRPSPEYCWVWVNRARTKGYWDYCY